MEEQTLQLHDVLDIIRRHFWTVVIIVAVCACIAFGAASVIPKRFKSKAVLDIPSSYFRNPLVSDLISEVTDPSELNSQRMAILRLALNDEYLDSLGERFGLFQFPHDHPKRVVERSNLFQRIEYFSLNSTSFQVGFSGGDARSVYEILTSVLDQMTFTLIEEKYKTLVKARDAIQNQVQFLSQSLVKVGKNGAQQLDTLQSELERIEDSIAILRIKYTASHPELSKLRQQAEVVRGKIRTIVSTTPTIRVEDSSKPFTNSYSKAPLQEIYNDLLKKLTRLNIILEMERDREAVSYLTVIEKPVIPGAPIFPNKMIFLIVGLLGGLAIALIQAVYRELKRNTSVLAEGAAELLGVPYFGQLPELVQQERTLLLTGPFFNLSSALPAPEIQETSEPLEEQAQANGR